MKLKEIYELIDRFAPFELSQTYEKKCNFTDNSGIIVGTEADITNVVFALDLTDKTIEYAQWMKAGLIITHHPAIFYGIKKIDGVLLKAASSGIGVISCHLNFDVAEKGVDYFLAKGISGADDKDIEILDPLLSGTGYGRRYPINTSLEELAENIEREFATKVNVYGDKTAFIKKADVFVTGEVKYHTALELKWQNIAFAAIGHYYSEVHVARALCKSLQNRANVIQYNLRFVPSETNTDPFD